MRVLHINNIADVARILAQAQRSIGVASEVAAVRWRYSGDVEHAVPPFPPWLANLRLFTWILRNLGRYDLIHYHGRVGPTAVYYRLRRHPAVLHLHGSDLRNTPRIRYSSFARWAFVSTPDLLKLSHRVDVEHVEYLPNPVFPEEIRPVDIEKRAEDVREGRRPICVHLPTDRRVKGTRNLIKAIELLKDDGVEIDLRIVEGVGPQEALRRMREADIVVDWVSPEYDIYGMVSIQAMAMKIPVLCHIDPHLYPHPPPLGVVEPTPEGVAKGLKRTIENVDRWGEMGEKERMYVERTHDAIKIAKRVKRVYEETLAR